MTNQRKEYLRQWRLRNPDYQRRWAKQNPEKVRGYSLKYQRGNRQKVNAANKLWSRNNQDRHLALQYAWKRRNAGKVNAINSRRRALKKSVTIGELTAIARVYERAKELKQWFDVVVDHRTPLARGGAHEAANLQIIYAYENIRKGSRLDYKPRVVFL